MRGLV